MLTRHSVNKKDSKGFYLLAFIFIFIVMNKWVFYFVGIFFTIFLATITFKAIETKTCNESKDIFENNVKYLSPTNQQKVYQFLDMKREIDNKVQVYRDIKNVKK